MRMMVTELPHRAGGRMEGQHRERHSRRCPAVSTAPSQSHSHSLQAAQLNALTVIHRSHKRKLIYNKMICISKYGYTKLEDMMKQAEVGRDLILIKEGVQIRNVGKWHFPLLPEGSVWVESP